ncbi:MAG: hypothetical protein U0936_13595 [Planctomycetaceae bacterium]
MTCHVDRFKLAAPGEDHSCGRFAVELPNQKLDESSSEATAQSSSEITNSKVIAEMVIAKLTALGFRLSLLRLHV